MPTKTLIARKNIEGEELVCLDPKFYEQLCECLQEQPYLTEYNRYALETFKSGESDGVFEVLNEEDVSTDPSVDDVNHPTHYTSHPSGVEDLHDPVNHPKHYTGHPSGVEVYDIAKHHCFSIGNAIKYILRHEHKGAKIQDLKKAVWYLQRKIEEYEAQEHKND